MFAAPVLYGPCHNSNASFSKVRNESMNRWHGADDSFSKIILPLEDYPAQDLNSRQTEVKNLLLPSPSLTYGCRDHEYFKLRLYGMHEKVSAVFR
jgi:hypothetical protein